MALCALFNIPGTYGNGTGLSSAAQCIDVQVGFYAPTGSTLPISCPSWGFCAGRALDTENSHPGSQPVGVQGGEEVVQQITQRQLVTQTIQLQASDPSAVNETAFLHHIASEYGLPVEAISLSLTQQEEIDQEDAALGEWYAEQSAAEEAAKAAASQSTTTGTATAMTEEGEAQDTASGTTATTGGRLLQMHRALAHDDIPAIATSLTLTEQQRLEDYQEELKNALREMAKQSRLMTAHRARALQSTSRLTYTVVIDPTLVDQTSSSSSADLASSLHGMASGITTSLAAALGIDPTLVNVTGLPTPTTRTEVNFARRSCSPGFWASSGSGCIPCNSGRYGSTNTTDECHICEGGTYQPEHNATECIMCTRGSFCMPEASAPLPCPKGRYSNAIDLADQEQCSPCQPGSVCSTGSTAPTPCSKGSYSDVSGASECTPCAGGRYQASLNATGCEPWPAGNYCPEGASAALPCDKGTYSSSTSLPLKSQCLDCPAGSFCVAGSESPTKCSAGSFAGGSRTALCSTCEEGKYSDHTGAVICASCPSGTRCPEGSNTPLPASCEPGSYIVNMSGYMDASSCGKCPLGTFCFGGAAQPSNCSVGTIADNEGLARCTQCEGGKFQKSEGKTMCIACEAGSYCPEGASAPLPCKKGRYSSAFDLADQEQCSPCPPGSACSTGSTQETPCAPGTYNPLPGQEECQPCSSGQYQDQKHSTACAICLAGWYSPNILLPTVPAQRVLRARCGQGRDMPVYSQHHRTSH